MLFSRGGILTPDLLYTTLRTMFPKLHDMEKKPGEAVPSTLRICRQRFPQRKPPPPARNIEDEDPAELETCLRKTT